MGALIRFELKKLVAEKRSLIGLLNILLINALFLLAFYLRGHSHGSRPHEVARGHLTSEFLNALCYTQTILVPSIYMLFPMVLITMGAYILAGEIEVGNIRLMLFRPVPRWQVLLAKFAALCVYSAVMLALLLVISYGSSLLLLPARGLVIVVPQMYGLGGRFLILPPDVALQRIFLSYALALPMLMSVSAFALMLALVTRHFVAACILASTIYFASYVIGTIPMLSAIHPFLPTRYWPFWKYAVLTPIPWERIGEFAFWTGAYTVGFLVLAAALFNLRDV